MAEFVGVMLGAAGTNNPKHIDEARKIKIAEDGVPLDKISYPDLNSTVS